MKVLAHFHAGMKDAMNHNIEVMCVLKSKNWDSPFNDFVMRMSFKDD